MSNQGLPILCLDFDGVIHDYRDGWKGGVIYGELTTGFFAWAAEAAKHFTLVIYSSRSKEDEGVEAMLKWLGEKADRPVTRRGYSENRLKVTVGAVPFEFAYEKPPAFLTIDDRAVCFMGTWFVPHLDPIKLREFKPWMSL